MTLRINYKLALQIFTLVCLAWLVFRVIVGSWRSENVEINAAGLLIGFCTLAIIDAIERKP